MNRNLIMTNIVKQTKQNNEKNLFIATLLAKTKNLCLIKYCNMMMCLIQDFIVITFLYYIYKILLKIKMIDMRKSCQTHISLVTVPCVKDLRERKMIR